MSGTHNIRTGEKCIKSSLEMCERKRPFGRYRHRGKNIKM